jgi:hypothetical protein
MLDRIRRNPDDRSRFALVPLQSRLRSCQSQVRPLGSIFGCRRRYSSAKRCDRPWRAAQALAATAHGERPRRYLLRGPSSVRCTLHGPAIAPRYTYRRDPADQPKRADGHIDARRNSARWGSYGERAVSLA